MRQSRLYVLLMYWLSAIFLATSVLPAHAHVSSWHGHEDRGHQHQSSVHVHDAVDHVNQIPDDAHEQAHVLSVIDLDHELVGVQPVSAYVVDAVGLLFLTLTLAASSVRRSPESTSPNPLQPVPHDSEPRAPPA